MRTLHDIVGELNGQASMVAHTGIELVDKHLEGGGRTLFVAARNLNESITNVAQYTMVNTTEMEGNATIVWQRGFRLGIATGYEVGMMQVDTDEVPEPTQLEVVTAARSAIEAVLNGLPDSPLRASLSLATVNDTVDIIAPDNTEGRLAHALENEMADSFRRMGRKERTMFRLGATAQALATTHLRQQTAPASTVQA